MSRSSSFHFRLDRGIVCVCTVWRQPRFNRWRRRNKVLMFMKLLSFFFRIKIYFRRTHRSPATPQYSADAERCSRVHKLQQSHCLPKARHSLFTSASTRTTLLETHRVNYGRFKFFAPSLETDFAGCYFRTSSFAANFRRLYSAFPMRRHYWD